MTTRAELTAWVAEQREAFDARRGASGFYAAEAGLRVNATLLRKEMGAAALTDLIPTDWVYRGEARPTLPGVLEAYLVSLVLDAAGFGVGSKRA